jgi:hypothetical protein
VLPKSRTASRPGSLLSVLWPRLTPVPAQRSLLSVVPADDVNADAMMYFWVPIVGLIGAAIARFQPDGMARALFAAALAHALVLAIALMIQPGTSFSSVAFRRYDRAGA